MGFNSGFKGLKYRAIYTTLSLFRCSVLKISLSQEWSSGFLHEMVHGVFLYPVEKEYFCHIFLIGFYFFYLIGQNARKDKVETCSGRCHCIHSSSDGREKKCHFLVPTILSFVVQDEQLLQSNKRLSLSALLPRGKPFFSPLHVQNTTFVATNSSFQDGINIKTTKIFHSVGVRLLICLSFLLYSSVYLLLDINITR